MDVHDEAMNNKWTGFTGRYRDRLIKMPPEAETMRGIM
jgi:hypothetical protein